MDHNLDKQDHKDQPHAELSGKEHAFNIAHDVYHHKHKHHHKETTGHTSEKHIVHDIDKEKYLTINDIFENKKITLVKKIPANSEHVTINIIHVPGCGCHCCQPGTTQVEPYPLYTQPDVIPYQSSPFSPYTPPYATIQPGFPENPIQPSTPENPPITTIPVGPGIPPYGFIPGYPYQGNPSYGGVPPIYPYPGNPPYGGVPPIYPYQGNPSYGGVPPVYPYQGNPSYGGVPPVYPYQGNPSYGGGSPFYGSPDAPIANQPFGQSNQSQYPPDYVTNFYTGLVNQPHNSIHQFWMGMADTLGWPPGPPPRGSVTPGPEYAHQLYGGPA